MSIDKSNGNTGKISNIIATDGPVEILRKMVSVPSHVDKMTDERNMGELVYTYLSSFPFLCVEKQYINSSGIRFNVIARTKGNPTLLIADHLDTVEPKIGWVHNQYEGDIEDGKLYGLGALDTKGGGASLLSAIQSYTDIKGLTILFYCDEEYDLDGMRKFLSECDDPGQLALVIEPTDLSIWNAHRGLIEFSISVSGKTGHAGNPASGINAIDCLYQSLAELKIWLATMPDKIMGVSSMNIANLRGGLNLGSENSNILIGGQGNNIADYAEAVIDIRPTNSNISIGSIQPLLTGWINNKGGHITSFKPRHDFGSLFTDSKVLSRIESLLKKIVGSASYLNPEGKGYGDGQLIAAKFPLVPVIYIGPTGQNMHAPNEYVEVQSLMILRDIYKAIIKEYCVTK